MGGSGNLRAKQQRGAAVRKGKATSKRAAAPSPPTQDSTASVPLIGLMDDKGKGKENVTAVASTSLSKLPTSSNSTHPPPSSVEIAKNLRHLNTILHTTTKILRIAAVENITIAEAMPDVPASMWFEAGKGLSQQVLERYGGLASMGGKVGQMVDMAVRAKELLAEIEEEGGLGREGRT